VDPDQLLNDYYHTFYPPAGQNVLYDLRKSFHVDTPMFEKGVDQMTLSFREGQRSVVLWILLTLESAINPEEVQTHSTEQPQEGQ